MDFPKYKRLKKAALGASSADGFLKRVAESPWWFGVPLWNKADYQWFYGKIKGGYTYAKLFNKPTVENTAR